MSLIEATGFEALAEDQAAVVDDGGQITGQPMAGIPFPLEHEGRVRGLPRATGSYVLYIYHRETVEATHLLHPKEQYLVLAEEKKMFPFSRDNPLSAENEARRQGLGVIRYDEMWVNGLTAPDTQYAPKYDFVELAS